MRLQVSLSAFCFLFSEMVQYQQTKVDTTQELEKKLAENGYNVGLRISELCFFREKNAKRETKIVGILSYIKDNIWKTMFGKAADSLERATDKQDECKLEHRPTPRRKCCAGLRRPGRPRLWSHVPRAGRKGERQTRTCPVGECAS
jgi:hypothetical protein